MPKKANIVYIFSDQHRGDTLGCVGHPTIITPNLDRLASQGVNFTNCFTNSPLCMPARASMMTGQYVCEHGIWDNNVGADSLSPSHVRIIRELGYHTALIGKTHLYTHDRKEAIHTNDNKHILENWGFEDICELTGPLASIRHDSPYTDYLKDKDLLEDFRSKTLEYWKEWRRGTAKPWNEPPSSVPAEDHLDSFTGKKTLEWIENYKESRPFYLQVLFPGPHDPFDSPQKYRDLYHSEDMSLGIMDWPEEPSTFYRDFVLIWSGLKGMTPEQKQQLRTYYYAKITLIDEYIGKIVKILEEKGLLDNTWIIYNSDHGEMLGDHMMSHKIVFYEQAIKIPLIIRPPGGINGWKCTGLTDHLDIAATLLEIAGASSLPGSAGRSLFSQIVAGSNASNAQKGKDVVFSEVFGFSMVRDKSYKLTVTSNRGEPVEFFDLINDPSELHNDVGNPNYKDIITNLIDKYINPLFKRKNEEKLNQFKTDTKRRIESGKWARWAKNDELRHLQ